jgi:hypothetical protein
LPGGSAVSRSPNAKKPRTDTGAGLSSHDYSGGVLLSQGATPQVPSALAGLTSVFGMGTGVTPPPWPPENIALGGPKRPIL